MPKLQVHKKRKKGNIAGRKNPAFGLAIKRISMDCLMRKDEYDAALKEKHGADFDKKADDLGRLITNPNDLPEGTTVVDTLYGHQLYVDSRLINHIDTIAMACCEFDDFFWESDESPKGSSICDLRRDRKNRTWCDDQLLLQFVYLCIAMNLAKWSYTNRKDWIDLPGGMPFVTFLGPKRSQIQESLTPNQNVGESNVEQNQVPN